MNTTTSHLDLRKSKLKKYMDALPLALGGPGSGPNPGGGSEGDTGGGKQTTDSVKNIGNEIIKSTDRPYKDVNDDELNKKYLKVNTKLQTGGKLTLPELKDYVHVNKELEARGLNHRSTDDLVNSEKFPLISILKK